MIYNRRAMPDTHDDDDIRENRRETEYDDLELAVELLRVVSTQPRAAIAFFTSSYFRFADFDSFIVKRTPRVRNRWTMYT